MLIHPTHTRPVRLGMGLWIPLSPPGDGDADDELLQPDLPVAASSRRPRSHATLTNRQPR
jgi:hypothetical protein